MSTDGVEACPPAFQSFVSAGSLFEQMQRRVLGLIKYTKKIRASSCRS